MTAPGLRTIGRKIAMARMAIGFERLWTAALWPMLAAAGFVASVAGGLLPLLPGMLRGAVAAAIGLVFLWSLRGFLRVSWPSETEAMRRIEERSGLAHRPVSALQDKLAGDSGGPAQLALWNEHRLRQLGRLTAVRVGPPRSGWARRDVAALRVPVSLALLAGLVLGPGDLRSNLADSVKLAPAAQSAPLTLDAWLKPPAYTAKPPLLLTSAAMTETLKANPDILVPENSVLTLRIANAAAPSVTFHELTAAGGAGGEVADIATHSKSEKGSFQSEAKLTRPVVVRVEDGSSLLAEWSVSLIPDAAPTVAITEMPVGDSSGTLTTKWKVADDYGVAGVTSEIVLADEQEDGTGFAGNGIFLYPPPKFPVTLRRSNAREEAGETSANLAEHPWAGFMVEITLAAKDAAGHSATSKAMKFRLPERVFTKPLSRALIEQRRSLILEPDRSGQVLQMLEALLTYPDGLIESSGHHIAIATVVSRLRAAGSQDDVDEAVKMLWQIATAIEDGSLANAKAELEALRKELERALSEGAPPERIAQLMEKLRGAMDRYVQSLMEETQKRLQQGGNNPNQQMQPGRMVSPEDLKKMLEMIEKLAESGANDAARQLLSQLDEILRNLQPGMNAQQMTQPGDSALGRMLDQLSDLMRKQQGLMDETQRMPQPGDGELSERDGREPGNRGPGMPQGGLAGRQDGLAEMLEQMLGELGKNGVGGPPSLGEAQKNMRGAGESLRQQDRGSALQQQGDAMDMLRDGAKELAQRMMQLGTGQQGAQGQNGEARGETDPLGRPRATRGQDYGPDKNILPSESAIRRAREILEMLRSRAGETGLPRIERDYIERLLRGLY